MNPSKLDRRISILKRDYEKTLLGANAEVWQDFANPYAEKVETSGDAILASLAQRNSVSVVFRIRYMAGLEAGEFRVGYGGRVFDITHVEEEGRKRTQVIYCSLLADNGPEEA